MKRIILLFFILILTVLEVSAKHIYPEKYYQNKWCSKWDGKQEVRLMDDTRIDCVTKNYAVEFDFAPKWAESIGQSLHYSRMTGKKPAIVLIIEDSSDFKYYNRIVPLCKDYNIALWYMETPKNQQNEYTEDDIISVLISSIRNFIMSIIKEIFTA